MTSSQPEPDPFAAPSPGQSSEPAGAGAVPPLAGPPAYPSATPPAYPSYPSYPSAPPGYPAAPDGSAWSGTQANNLAVWSLVLAVLSWVCFGILTSIPAIIIGARAKRAADEGRANNRGMAVAGYVLGWISTVLNALSLIAVGVLIATRGWDATVELFQFSTTSP